MQAAKRLVAELVQASTGRPDAAVASWAAGVVQTSAGVRTVVASSLGGGEYVPAGVFLPVGVRVATRDIDLPMGWASRFVGWQVPTDVIVAHSELLGQRDRSVELLAVAGSNPAARPPEGVPYAVVTAGDSEAWAGARQHRLATVDPALAQRLAAVGSDPGRLPQVGWEITRYVFGAAAAEHEAGGVRLIDDYDTATLAAVGQGRPVNWEGQLPHVMGREGGAVWFPEMGSAVVDLDDSAASQIARAGYQRLYRMGRLAEMVLGWQHHPTPVMDIAYCGLLAGFGAAVQQALSLANVS